MSKIELSEEELRMKGAPEGDIFACEVLSDDQLEPEVDPKAFMNQFFAVYSKDTPWSEQFMYIEKIRAVIFHSPVSWSDEFNCKVQECLIDGLDSLRSSTLRSSILCAGLYLKKVSLRSGEFKSLVNAMMTRTAGCPKFIIDLAEESLSNAFASLNALTVSLALMESTKHKNMDIVSKAYILIKEQVPRLDAQVPDFMESFQMVFHALCIGLNTKKVSGKEACRNALHELKSMVDEELFSVFLNKCKLSESQMKLVQKEVLNYKAKVAPKRAHLISSETSEPLRKRSINDL